MFIDFFLHENNDTFVSFHSQFSVNSFLCIVIKFSNFTADWPEIKRHADVNTERKKHHCGWKYCHLISSGKCSPVYTQRKTTADVLMNADCFSWINMLELQKPPCKIKQCKLSSLLPIIKSLTQYILLDVKIPPLF